MCHHNTNPVLSFLLFLILCSCQTNTEKRNTNETQSNTMISNVETQKQAEKIKPEYYKLIGEDIVIRTGPGPNFDKLINKKATEMLGETHYCEADNSFLVEIVEEKGDWVKIETVRPEHLQSIYDGWIPKRSVKFDDTPEKIERLDPATFEVFFEKHYSNIENCHIYILQPDMDKDKARAFCKSFIKYNCKGNCNISIYDSKDIKNLLGVYPLKGDDYIELADHFIAQSSSDSPESVWWYPYQDIQYKEYGGKNWKKEPIE
jgi:hypothetical protein